MNDEEILRHFDGKPAFREFRMQWSDQDKATFCRLARAVHNAGLDWWHIRRVTLIFGRKEKDQKVRKLGAVSGKLEWKINWNYDIGGLNKFSEKQPLNEDKVAQIEAALVAGRNELKELSEFKLKSDRSGLWPDQLGYDIPGSDILGSDDDDDDDDDEYDDDLPMNTTAFNRIYYGPPGTGKTWKITKLLKRDYEQEMTSLSVDDWRKQFITDRIAPMSWWEVIFMALNLDGRAKVNQLLKHSFILAKAKANDRKKNLPNTIWGELQAHTINDSTTVRENRRRSPQIFDKSRESVWQLAGDWKELCADLIALVDAYQSGSPQSSQSFRRHSFVTFHQSYGYEEFVEGLRPVLDDADESGAVKYEIRDGVFKELCRRASETPDQRFAMVIDEINRGNISKIFGELITLIELDKREGAENKISVILPYSGAPFSIPPNVDIIGTMNTADRSLALLDTALRRRFDFVPVMPDVRDVDGSPLFGLRVTSGQKEINIPRMLSAINQRIEALYDRDHCIGHAYFTSLEQVTDGEERMTALSDIFSKRIIPLLEEYFFEDWQKIRLVLADNQKPEAAKQFVLDTKDQDGDLTRLFGNDHGLTAYGTKRRYQIQNAAFNNPDAYIGIYEKLQDS